MKSFFIGLLLFTASVWAEPSLEEIQNIQIGDIKKISAWVNDKKTKPRFKVMILERLNILLLSNQENVSKNADDLLELLSGVKKNNKDDGSSYNFLLRKKTCLFLSYFNGTEREEDSYEMIKANISSEDNGDVAATCIQVIASYQSKKDETNKMLVRMLDSSIKKKAINDEDIEIASSIIDVLEKFKKKQSYLTLLKVLESKYPTDIKNKAKKTLETLPQ
jgi:hypothetical protein